MQNLRIPGPTPCPDDIIQGSAKPMINHRGPEFEALLLKSTEGLKEIFQTTSDLYILTASGTGAMEAAVVNTLCPGDKALLVTIGVFGSRFGQIAETYGVKVTRLEAEWGQAADPQQVRQALRSDPDVKAVMVTHNETSTGVTNDLQAIARAVKEESDALLLVDAISSIGCVPLPVDEWDCDVMVTGSQKGFMIPPGLAFVSFNQRAWKAYERSTMPRFYFDIGKAMSYYNIGQTPWTPAVSVLYGLELALDKMLSQGMPSIFEHHQRLGQITREGVKSLGLALFADESVASNTVTAVRVPPGVDGKRLVEALREDHDVVIAGGQQELSGKIFRIGHLGYCTEEDVRDALKALEKTLPKVGFTPSRAGVEG